MAMLRNFEIVQQLNFLTEEQIIKAINIKDENGINHLKNYAYILHDKDKTEPHWHIFIKMDNSYTFENIAKRFNVPTNQVNKIQTTFAQALNYATHNTEQAQKDGKYKYNDEEVKSNYEWKKERQIAIDKPKTSRLDEIIDLIDNGILRGFNICNELTTKELIKYDKEIKIALNTRQKKLKGVNKNMEVIFISGGAGVGKSVYAKKYAEKLNYSVHISSGSNDILDGYEGEDCILLDDLRPDCMGLSDLLKMLDNHTSSSVKSRYKNKYIQECRLIIITTVLSLDDFFKEAYSTHKDKEPIQQLHRRCKTKIKMDKNYMYISIYDEAKEKYAEELKTKNTYINLYKRDTYNSREEEINAMKKFIIMEGQDIINPEEEIIVSPFTGGKMKAKDITQI